MLAAVDSRGSIYLSLAQANSNKQVFGMFLRYLSLKLDRDRPGWRVTSLILLDGAAYHVADSTKQLIKKLRLPVSVLGPYSYQSQPAELFFSAFKSSDINPHHIATTKSNFD